jgi:hydroxyethylthiazole kinase-like uncharacterized protein yjeF
MSTSSERILSGGTASPMRRPLFNIAATRQFENTYKTGSAEQSLMRQAGAAIARLVMAVAPYAREIWIPCGPGNNGADGLEAALYLHRMGKKVVVTELIAHAKRSGGALTSHQRATEAGVVFSDQPPAHFDLCIDALFGIGKFDGFDIKCQTWISLINASTAKTLAVDIPTGLEADTGRVGPYAVYADWTLSLLTLKPGLFTANGRDCCGDIWMNELGVPITLKPCAYLGTRPALAARAHNTHKGTFGDVAVIGGDVGMVGAAMLAARASLHNGSGRVYVGLLAAQPLALDNVYPEVMIRDVRTLALEEMAVVAGCGGGDAMAAHLRDVIIRSKYLVMDADALNHLAQSPEAQIQLKRRASNRTVLTPHPLEAARLLATNVSIIQANRLEATQRLADTWQCAVVLKGSGTVIAAPRTIPVINPTGNARLATAGTGDVLAGMLGSLLAQHEDAFDASCNAVYLHGQVADSWSPNNGALTAHRLARAL